MIPANWAVFPLLPMVNDICTCNLGSECERAGKHPAGSWGRYTPGMQLGSREGAGHGIRTGREFGIFVVDLDIRPGKDGLAALKAMGSVPATYTVRTPTGGFHLYFKHPGTPIKTSGNELAPGIDVRGEGGFVVAEGSPHRNGGVYDRAFGDVNELADAPAWLLERIAATRKARPDFDDGMSEFWRIDRGSAWEAQVLPVAIQMVANADPAVEGEQGSARTFELAAKLARWYRLCDETIFEVLSEHFNPRCLPPWNDSDLARKVHEGATKSTLDFQVPAFESEDIHEALLSARTKVRTAAAAERVKGLDTWFDLIDLTTLLGSKSEVEIARRIQHCLSPIAFSEGSFYRYSPTGIWEADVEACKTSCFIQAHDGLFIAPVKEKNGGTSSGQLELGSGAVKGVEFLLKKRVGAPSFFEEAPVGLACANGFVRLDTDGSVTVLPHAKEHRARIFLPFDFVADAEAPQWDAFLDGVFRDDSDRDLKKQLVEEFLGGALFGISSRMQKAIIAIGTGANGKSALFDIAERVFPENSVVSIALHDMGSDQKVALLRGRALNIVGEVAGRAFTDTESAKAVIVGDAITAKEVYEKAFTFRPTCGHLLAANRLPDVRDQEHGFWRRLIVLEFNRRFDENDRVVNIGQNIVEAERGAIVARLVRAAGRLVRRGHYVEPTSHAAAADAWKTKSDVVATFVAECVTPMPSAVEKTGVKARDLYLKFADWCQVTGEKGLNEREFSQRMKGLGMCVIRGKASSWYPISLTGGASTWATEALAS